MADIAPEDVPDDLLAAATRSHFHPGELAIEHDVHLRRLVAAVLTGAREQIAQRVEAVCGPTLDGIDGLVHEPADVVRAWPGGTDG